MLLIMNVESATKTWIQVFLRGGPRVQGQVIPEIEIGKEKKKIHSSVLNFYLRIPFRREKKHFLFLFF